MLVAIKEAAQYLKGLGIDNPEVGIVLGTGLGGLVNDIEVWKEVNYADIPNFPLSTVESHAGKMIYGMLSGRRVLALQGRFHFYEGYSMQQVVMPIRVMKMLGVNWLLISNACGSLVPEICAGSLMIIDDHINMLGANPLIGRNMDELGPRFPDMSQPYDHSLIHKAKVSAQKHGIEVHQGVYVAVTGPNLETKAEYKFLRIIGGHVVGMSTVPEVLAARQMDMPVFAISVITDEGWHEDLKPVSLDDVIRVASQAEPKMTLIMKELISLL